MYYIAITKSNFGKDMLFWDKKAKAFMNNLPDMKRDGYKGFSAAHDKRVGVQEVWSKLVDECVAAGGKYDEIKLYTLGSSCVKKIANGENFDF